MQHFNLSRRGLLAAASATCLLATSTKLLAQGTSADYTFVEGNAQALANAKRVIITNFVCAFQLESSVRKDNATKLGNTTFFGGNTKEVAAKMAWKSPDTAIMQDIADKGLAALKADFKSKGIEVLDESVLAAQPAYQNILAASALKNLDDYNVVGIPEAQYRKASIGPDVTSATKIVSPRGLTPYGHSVFEGGQCCHVTKGFPSNKVYYIPGYEIELAKALDAVVVKVWQFIYFSQVDASVKQEGWAGGVGGAIVNYNASAKSIVRIGEQKTRMSFRLPSSANKSRNTPTSWLPKDGDVVVSLGKPLMIGDQYFDITDAGATSGQSIRASLGGTQHINFAATLSKPDAYRSDLIKGIDANLNGLLTTALGR